MKNFTIALVAALSITAIAGCKKKDGAAAGGADCTATVAKIVELQAADMAKALPADKVGEVKSLMTGALVPACTNDKWSADAQGCVAAAADKASFKACDEKYPEVKTSAKGAMMAVMPKVKEIMMGAMAAPTLVPPPADTAGSAAAPTTAPAPADMAGSAAAPAAAPADTAAPAAAPADTAAPAAAGSAAPETK